MTCEEIRGCGYRKVGAMYLVGKPGKGFGCDQLPFVLEECECCGFTPKVKRGYSYLTSKYFKEHGEDCSCPKICPICNPQNYEGESYLVMRVSSRYYKIEDYVAEAKKVGVSLRTSRYPRDFVLGETWIMLSHAKAGIVLNEEGEEVPCPAIFFVFRPDKLEKLIWESEATEEVLAELHERGITPVIIPDGDSDHDAKKSSIRDDLRKAREEAK